jgi:hypothetical protein
MKVRERGSVRKIEGADDSQRGLLFAGGQDGASRCGVKAEVERKRGVDAVARGGGGDRFMHGMFGCRH